MTKQSVAKAELATTEEVGVVSASDGRCISGRKGGSRARPLCLGRVGAASIWLVGF